MSLDDFCYEEKLPFVKYLNEKVLLYCITLLAFAGIFLLIWVIQNYTFFEKAKILRGSLPKLPYGNLDNVVNKDNTIYEMLWKNYNRFKRKQCDIGGVFFFTKPVVVVVNPECIQEVLDNSDNFKQVFPEQVSQNIGDIFTSNSANSFIQKYRESLRGVLSEKLQNYDFSTVLRSHLLEMASLAFGLNSPSLVEEINHILKAKTDAKLKYHLGLCYPLLKSRNSSLYRNLNSLFVDITQARKTNDNSYDDIIQYFMDFQRKSSTEPKIISRILFDLYADVLTHTYSVVFACFCELSKNEDVQDELLGEIRRYNKKHSVMDIDSLKELEYLNAVVLETLRKYPPVPFILKIAQKDFTLNNVQFPKGVLTAISILGIHRNPDNYTNPEDFDPDRFAEQTNSAFLPFGNKIEENVFKLVVLFTKLLIIDTLTALKVSRKNDSNAVLKFDRNLIPLRLSESYLLTFENL
ncbi:cytochrome P450 6B5-like [Rhynchophorus ferrugineus]|uniref:cytochrome P450 6B5-like n=1 Tax=Rhynchophorus ferrugineus TaxID=354439 RepID=UPI003FCC7DF6